MNINIELPPNKIIEALLVSAEANVPCFLWGAPGIGKSDVMREVCRILGLIFIDIRLTTKSPIDLAFPMPDAVRRVVTWLIDEIIPRVGDAPSMIFLDEASGAPPSVQITAYRMLQDRQIGDHKLPDNCILNLAGNRVGDRSVAYELSKALESRATHLTMVPELNNWCRYALKHGVDHSIISFVRFDPECFFNFEETKDDPGPYACPRTWVNASKLVKAKPDKLQEIVQTFDGIVTPETGHQQAISFSTLSALLAGTVGVNAAARYTGFLRVYREIPTLDSVIRQPKKATVPSDTGARFAMCTGLAARATTTNIDNIMLYMDRMPAEFREAFVNMATERDGNLCHTTAYTSHVVNNPI